MIHLFRTVNKLAIFLFLVSLGFKSFAINEQFLLDLDFKYKVSPEGFVEISKNIGIINVENELSVTSFTQNLEEYNYYDLTVSDSSGPVEIKEIDEDTSKRIVVPLRGSKIGKNQINYLTIKYKSKELLKKVGSIYFLNLPKVPKKNVRNLNVEIEVPKSLGNEIFISPTNFAKTEAKETNIYKFLNNSSIDKAISTTFGEFQIINFNIKYELQNNSYWFENQEIALIPDIKKRQEVSILELNPKPTEIYKDEDGNYLAKFRINPKSKLEISYKGTVRIYGPTIDINNGSSFKQIPEDISKNYTKSQKYWESDSQEIQDVAKALLDKNQSVTFNAFKIYKFLTENYKYNFEITKNTLVERNGALKAIKREAPLGCMEFTDSFIAIARAMGIPAREINGFAVTDDPLKKPINIDLENGDKLHSWAEFYDSELGWVQIDPTWGATSGVDYFSKLDLNHVTFAVKGIDSEYPIPAGMYKINPDSKQIEFDFPNQPNLSDFDYKIRATRVFSFNFLQLLGSKEPIRITNFGKTSIFNVSGEDVLPFQEKIVYQNKTDEKYFEKFNGEIIPLEVNGSFIYYILIIVYISFVGLLLYVILYFLVVHSKDLQKLFDRLFRLPRGRGR